MSTKYSKHASARLQQRGIPAFVLELLETCGSGRSCGGGAEKFTFDRAARKRLRNYLGGERGLRMIEPWLHTFSVIADDGTVVTTGHNFKLNRHR